MVYPKMKLKLWRRDEKIAMDRLIKEKERMLFDDYIKQVILNDDITEWITVYFSKNSTEISRDSYLLYCALIPNDLMVKSLSETEWDLRPGEEFPSLISTSNDDSIITTYSRLPKNNVEPLYYFREFYRIVESTIDIAEEFRLYFNIYEDKLHSKYYIIEENGDLEEVVIVNKSEIKIKTKVLLEYLRIKKMVLGLFISYDRFSANSITELGVNCEEKIVSSDNFIYKYGILKRKDTYPDIQTQSYIFGKKLICPPLQLVEKKKIYEKYIIGFDKNGEKIEYACDDNFLSNYFGKNKGLPHYLTPVYFKREVLSKYYALPAKYTVRDGSIICGSLWMIRIDNNQSDCIMVYLGDLGHLPHKEQLYWKSFNISPQKTISKAAFRRNIEGEFADPNAKDLYFKQLYNEFQNKWKQMYGWFLFLPLRQDDEHHFSSLRRLLANDQKEFDEQILSITKILVDSINVSEIKKYVSCEQNEKSILLLESFLKDKNYEGDKLNSILLKIQTLRSSGVAHRKGENYDKAKQKSNIVSKSLKDEFDDILNECINALEILMNNLNNNKSNE